LSQDNPEPEPSPPGDSKSEASPKADPKPQSRQRGRFQRLLLFSAGASEDVLDYCPRSEERLYAGLGSLVLVTTMLAFIAMFVVGAVGFKPQQTPLRGVPLVAIFIVALIWAFMIYVIDRFLVMTPLHPVRLDEKLSLPMRAWEWIRTVLGILPRLLLALVAGFLIAEPILLVAFRSEIAGRVAELQLGVQQRMDAKASTTYNPIINRESEALSSANDEITRLEHRKDELPGLIDQADKEASNAKSCMALERNGDPMSHPDCRTTGLSGAGPQTNAQKFRYDQAVLQGQQLQQEKTTVEQRLQELNNGQEGKEHETHKKNLNKAIADQKFESDKANPALQSGNATPKGLLIQIQALEDLAADHHPFDQPTPATSATPATPTPAASATPTPAASATPTPAASTTPTPAASATPTPAASATPTPAASATPTPAASATPAAFTEPAAALSAAPAAGFTTLGKTVWLTRGFLIVVDTMAVVGKLFVSLRRRRPYDIVSARMEEKIGATETVTYLGSQENVAEKKEEFTIKGFRRRSRLRKYDDASRAGWDVREHMQVTYPCGHGVTFRPNENVPSSCPVC
jgi:hypothetical protein